MNKLIDFLKRHWQLLAIIILVYLLIRGRNNYSPLSTAYNLSQRSAKFESTTMPGVGGAATPLANDSYTAPAPASQRMTVKNSSLSLLVNDVSQSIRQISQKTYGFYGYVVEGSLSNPDGIKTGSITVRVPAKKLDQALVYFKSLSLRVVSESISGYDITDQYTDIQARLDTLNKTKAKFEEILTKATLIPDILEVQRNLISLQDQIDSLKGQEQYLKQDAEMSRVTIYLSTDELSLPYTPNKPWQPTAIFKTAVRSLLGVLRGVGTLIIWIVVFGVIWIPALIIYKLLKKRVTK